MILTSKQALTEARKRWGKNAIAERAMPVVVKGKTVVGSYKVGALLFGCFDIKGHGESWGEAFANADKKS